MKAPAEYKTFGPIFAPYLAKKGANTNAAKLAIPNTKPYWLGVAPLFSASLG